jgi:hypothetical protein
VTPHRPQDTGVKLPPVEAEGAQPSQGHPLLYFLPS